MVASSSPSSQTSHLISFGFSLEEAEVAATVVSTPDAKRLTGSEEAEKRVEEAVLTDSGLLSLPRGLSGTVGGISKMPRHRGHLKGAWPISKGDYNYIQIRKDSGNLFEKNDHELCWIHLSRHSRQAECRQGRVLTGPCINLWHMQHSLND